MTKPLAHAYLFTNPARTRWRVRLFRPPQKTLLGRSLPTYLEAASFPNPDEARLWAWEMSGDMSIEYKPTKSVPDPEHV